MERRSLITAPPRPAAAAVPLYNAAPYITAPFVSTTRNTRNGRSMLVPVSAAAATPITITHNLGRLVQGMHVVLNNGGASYAPRVQFVAGPRSNTQQAIQFEEDAVNALLMVF